MSTQGTSRTQGGTNPALNPGNYELGSLESRAAARAMLAESDQLLAVLRYHFIGSDEGEDIVLFKHHREFWKTKNGVRYEKKKPDDGITPKSKMVGPDIFVPFALNNGGGTIPFP